MNAGKRLGSDVVAYALKVWLDDGQTFLIMYDKDKLDRLFWQFEKQGIRAEWAKSTYSWEEA